MSITNMKSQSKNHSPQHFTPTYTRRLSAALLGCSLSTLAFGAPVTSFDTNNMSNATGVTPNQKPLQLPEFRKQEDKESFVLPPAPKSSPLAEQEKVQVKQITFTGNTVINNDELQKIALSFLNRPLSVRDLEELRSRVTAIYVDAGYINSGAMIPPQSVAIGVLQIKIIEGQLTDVKLEGMGRLREAYVRDRLIIGAGSPLNFKNLQDRYQVMLADPLIDRLNGSLQPGTHPGDGVLSVKVTRARPYQLYAGADDYTTPIVGGYTGRLGGWVDNLSGFGERIDANFMATGGSLGVNTGIEIPLNAYDTHATFRYSNSSSSLVEKPINQLDIRTNVIGYEGGLSQPLYRTPDLTLKAGINLSVRESHSTLLGQPFSFTEGLPSNQGTTQVTVLRLWQQFVKQGARDAFVARSTFNTGMNSLGSTIQNDSLLPSGDFFSWLGQSQYSHRVMDNGAQIVWKGVLQQSADPLLPLERFALGGVYSVRGYRENYYVRDNGFSTGLEFRYPMFGGEPAAKHSLFFIPFMDYGGAWNNSTHADLNPKKDYLHSIGIGFDWHYKQMNTEFYWAHSITNVKALSGERNIQDDGIHFKVGFVAF
ncbi:MAG: BamA/TamA family outer membrane protein [Methylobacter sp.]|nr:BamA/TamA family outer membrane protein [Methylobacter sp.]